MDRPTILQIHDHRLDVEASAGVYQKVIALWGRRDAHTQLLQELRAWADAAPLHKATLNKGASTHETSNAIC